MDGGFKVRAPKTGSYCIIEKMPYQTSSEVLVGRIDTAPKPPGAAQPCIAQAASLLYRRMPFGGP